MATDFKHDFRRLDQAVRQSFEPADEFPQDLYSLTLGSRHQGKDHGLSRKYLLIRLAQSCFAVPLSSVREVMGLPKISPLPNMPFYFAGLINLRGKIVSTIHLQKSLDPVVKKPVSKVKRPCVVIVECQSRLFGAIIDDVVSVVSFAPETIDHAMDDVAHAEYFNGIIKFQNGILAPILNLEKALKFEELIKAEQGRAA